MQEKGFEHEFTGKLKWVQIPFFQVSVENDIFIIFQQEKKRVYAPVEL